MNDIKRKMHHLTKKMAYAPDCTPKSAVALALPVHVPTAASPALTRLQRRAHAARIVH